ncbi:MAG: hypothetical protein HRT60_13045 [Dinoroseobacter sp.]|nr:hypothetical protein [Dinoroseobacter sp.]
MSDTLYAWGQKIEGLKIWDHTWVTNYEIPTTGETDEQFWYCWGKKYDECRAQVGKGTGSVELANKVMPANERAYEGEPDGSPAINMGSIVYYGLDGVCHQTANQVLAATATASNEPARVADCHGYAITTFFYNTYGLNTGDWERLANGPLDGLKLAGDDFLERLKDKVPSDKQDRVIEIRETAQDWLRAKRDEVVQTPQNYYKDMQIHNLEVLGDLFEYLGYEDFKKLFPSLDILGGDLDNPSWSIKPY